MAMEVRAILEGSWPVGLPFSWYPYNLISNRGAAGLISLLAMRSWVLPRGRCIGPMHALEGALTL